jgi:flavin-dependent dehydrogenase
MPKPYDALIVGAGPAGSSAAILLACRGWRVLVMEKAQFPRRKVCGEYISGAAWPLLDELGVGARVAAAAGPEIRRVGLFADDAVMASTMPGAGRQGRALGREHLDTILVERARECGAEVREGVACERIDDNVANVVIGAHGAWEAGALPTNAPRRAARPRDLLGFKAHFRNARLPADLMPLVLFPGGYGGMVTTDGGRVSLSCCVTREALARSRASRRGHRAGEALLAHIVDTNRGVRETLLAASLEGAWLSAGPIRPAIRRFRADGIFAIGNAVGEAHPIIAEGISMAIQSSFLLCERLFEAGADASETALEAVGSDYEAAWRRNFAARTRAAAAFAALTTRHPTRAIAVRLLPRLPAFLTLGAHWSGKDRMLRRAALEIRS